jgi:hypothetical protein
MFACQIHYFFVNEIQNQQGKNRCGCTTRVQPYFFVYNNKEIEWSSSRSSFQDFFLKVKRYYFKEGKKSD